MSTSTQEQFINGSSSPRNSGKSYYSFWAASGTKSSSVPKIQGFPKVFPASQIQLETSSPPSTGSLPSSSPPAPTLAPPATPASAPASPRRGRAAAAWLPATPAVDLQRSPVRPPAGERPRSWGPNRSQGPKRSGPLGPGADKDGL